MAMEKQRPRILIAGSGAVGAVFAEHLTRAGCEVAFLVRDPGSPNARMPRSLHHFRLRGKPETVTQALPCITEADERWEQCWITLPSTALQGDWLPAQLNRLGTNARIFNWSPDLEDREYLRNRLARPIHMGLIGLVSFQTPLPGHQSPEKGIGYLLPPRSATFERTPEGKQAAALLESGGLPAATNSNLPWLAARLSGMLIPAVAALELEDWSLEGLLHGKRLSMVSAAAREAIRISARYLEVKPGLATLVPRPALYRLLLGTMAQRIFPVDLEAYLAWHFDKVAGQTRKMLDTWIGQANQHGMTLRALASLHRQLVDRY